MNGITDTGAVFVLKLSAAPSINPRAKPQTGKARLPALDWRIFGSKGEIRITCYPAWALSVGVEDLKLEIVRAEDGLLEEVDIGTDEWGHGRVGNIARVYEAFAQGEDQAGEKAMWFPDFEHALKTHKLIDDIYKENRF